MHFLPLKYYIPHLVFFGVFLAALSPVLYYYQRRNPSPRFRPGVGEMTMITVVTVFIGAVACFFLGNFFRGDRKPIEKTDYGAGWSEGTSTSQEKDDSRAPRGKD